MKECPFCAEEIQVEAIKCRFCNEWIEENNFPKKPEKNITIQQQKGILKKYLGTTPIWFDIRKKEIFQDNINIKKWQINMNFLIQQHGTIHKSEKKALHKWQLDFQDQKETELDFSEYLHDRVSLVLKNISQADLPPILGISKDRNWFLAAYPDVFEYFFPQINLELDNFEKEMKRVEKQVHDNTDNFDKMIEHLESIQTNQTICLLEMKRFYQAKINQNLGLSDEGEE